MDKTTNNDSVSDGQGLFTQCDVKVGEKLFRIVYDCGEIHRKLKQAEPYLESLGGKKLDLLVISHFDWDHISFIPRLLDITEGADRAWIPYVAPKLRILFAIVTAIQAEFSGNQFADYRDAVALAANPRRWLEGRGVDEIKEVGRPEEEGGEGPPTPTVPEGPQENIEEDPPGPDKIGLSLLRPWNGAFRRNSRLKASWSSLDAGLNPDLRERTLFEHILILITWIKPLSLDEIDDLCQKVADLLSDEVSDVLKEHCDLRMNEEISEKDVINLVKLICNKKNKARLMDMYKEFCGDLNSSSLFLMAQVAGLKDIPISSKTLTNHITFFSEGPFLKPIDWHDLPLSLRDRIRRQWLGDIDPEKWLSMHPALLWCGDAPLEILDELMNDALDDLSKRLEATNFWQIPHHGSQHSFNQRFYDKLKPAKGFISYGLTNTFDHPSPRVVRHTGAEIVTELSKPLQFSITWK